MLRFLFVFFLVYGSLNFYAWWTLCRLIPGQRAAQLTFAVFAFLMTVGPILVRQIERADWGRTALVFGLAAYLWMAALLWFDSLAALRDLWNLGARGLAYFWPAAARGRIPLRPGLAVIGALVGLTVVWSLIAAQRIRLERLRIGTPRLARGTSLRILQISDVHLGLIERGRRLDQILHFVDRLHPDLILSTGDLVDGSGDHLNHLYERLAAVRPPLGKFAVTGNHEFYVGIKPSVEFHNMAGFRLLRGEAVELDGGRLHLAGVDDPTVLRLDQNASTRWPSEPALLGDHPNGAFTILMKHQPTVLPASVGKFDLMLSGHTHRGQIFPFSLVVRSFFRYLSGTFELGQGSLLHVSRGTGTWGPPLRLFAPPEVTLITLEGA